MTTRRQFIRLPGALAGLTLANGMVQAAQDSARKGGRLVVPLIPEPPTLLQSNTHPSLVIALNISDGLIGYDHEYNPVPHLATSWTTSRDGKVVTFKLRRGVKWHDGTPLTSRDVKFSIEAAKATNTISGPTLSRLTSVTAPAEDTVVLRFSEPSQALWSVLDGAKTQIVPYHLYNGKDVLSNPLNNKPVGNGPFRFKEWVRGSHVTLERNPEYWDKGKPLLDEITFRFIPDAGARAIALQTGEAHYTPLLAIPLIEAKRIESNPQSPLGIERRGWEATAPLYFLGFNLNREHFKDVRVRRAFAHAIDLKLLAQNGFFGFATPATGPVPSYQKKFYTADTQQYEYSVEKAEKLLDEAGLRKGADGVRLRIDNLPLPYGEDYTRTAQLIQQLLKRVGVEVTLKNYDIATYFKKLNVEQDYDTASLYYSSYADPQVGAAFRRFWSKAGETPTGGNANSYVSAQVDKLIEASLIEGDPAKRQALIHQIQKQVQIDLPSISLLELQFFRVYSKRLQGLDTTPFGNFASLANVSFKG